MTEQEHGQIGGNEAQGIGDHCGIKQWKIKLLHFIRSFLAENAVIYIVFDA